MLWFGSSFDPKEIGDEMRMCVAKVIFYIKRRIYFSKHLLLAENSIICVNLSMVSRTDCIALYVDRAAGSQTYGHNEF